RQDRRDAERGTRTRGERFGHVGSFNWYTIAARRCFHSITAGMKSNGNHPGVWGIIVASSPYPSPSSPDQPVTSKPLSRLISAARAGIDLAWSMNIDRPREV